MMNSFIPVTRFLDVLILISVFCIQTFPLNTSNCKELGCNGGHTSWGAGGYCYHCFKKKSSMAISKTLGAIEYGRLSPIELLHIPGTRLRFTASSDYLLFYYDPRSTLLPDPLKDAELCQRTERGNKEFVKLKYVLVYSHPVNPTSYEKSKGADIALTLGPALGHSTFFRWNTADRVDEKYKSHPPRNVPEYQYGYIQWTNEIPFAAFTEASNAVSPVLRAEYQDQSLIELFRVYAPRTDSGKSPSEQREILLDWANLVAQSTSLYVTCTYGGKRAKGGKRTKDEGYATLEDLEESLESVRELFKRLYRRDPTKLRKEWHALLTRVSSNTGYSIARRIIDDAGLAEQESTGKLKGVTAKCAKQAKTWTNSLVPTPPPTPTSAPVAKNELFGFGESVQQQQPKSLMLQSLPLFG